MSFVIITEVLFLLILISNTHQLSTKDTNVCRTRTGLECCFGYVLSQDKSKCEECPPGFYGNACKKECLEGQYGRLCDFSCHCMKNQVCDKAVGCVLKKDVSKSDLVTVGDSKKKLLYATIVQLSTGTNSMTNSSDATNQSNPLMSSATKQATVVYYVIYSSSGFLAMFSILLLIAGCTGYKLKSSKNSTVFPIVVKSIYDDIGETENTLMISNINHQEKKAKCPYLKNDELNRNNIKNAINII